MKNHNENSLTEADYSNMLPSASDNSNKKDAKPRQKMDFSNTLPDFISGKRVNQATKPQSTTQTPQSMLKALQGTSNTGGVATDMVVQDAQKNAQKGSKSTGSETVLPVLSDGYEFFADINSLNKLFDTDVAEKIQKDMENAPNATMVNINGKAADLSPGVNEITVFANNNTSKVPKELLREFYMLFKVDETKHIAYFGLKRNVSDSAYKHVNVENLLEVVELKAGKILVVNTDIFKVLFK